MYPLLDHDDFQKSRKALMATSAFMIIVHDLNFVGSEFMLSGVKFELNKETIIGFATVFLVYFFYVFVLRSLETSFTTRVERIKESLAKVQAEMQADLEDLKSMSQRDFTRGLDGGEAERRIEMLKEFTKVSGFRTDAASRAIYIVKMITFATVDMTIPVIIATLAFVKAGSLSAAGHFLF